MNARKDKFYVKIRGGIRVHPREWYHPLKPEYWSGSTTILVTTNRKKARRLFDVVKLGQTNRFYHAVSVSLYRSCTLLKTRSL